MKTLLHYALLALVALCGLATAGAADANGRHHHGRAHVGIWFGGPAYPYYRPYYYPYYYPPAVVAAPAAPPVYIEQTPSAAAAAPIQGTGQYWYYCPDSRTYYPYVQQCATPWQQVVPQTAPPG